MKTAISLPDKLGHAADLYAAQQDMSRSELYAKALAEYLQRHRYDTVTEKYDQLMTALSAPSADQGGESGLESLRQLPW